MAGDWIKIQHALPDKPEVVQMAAELGIDQDAVTGKLVRLWIWADQQSVNGNGLSVTETFLDRVTFVTGFAQALRSVGWLDGEDGALSLPNFERHNGTTAKTRANGQKRTELSRSRNAASVTETSTKALPEKRREENINKTQSDRCTESDEQTANYIWDQIHQSFPNQRKPNLQSWADTIRLMRERDELADAEIRRVFDWAHEDSFWRPNILSPKKLREKWNVLEARADTPAPKPEIKPGTPEWSARSIKWLEPVREWQAMANRGEITDAEFNRRVAEAAARAPE
jgi:hypothetical protein